jgi:hypothetical protein
MDREELLQAMCAVVTGGECACDSLPEGDWRRLVDLAEGHGMAPLLFWSLALDGWPANAPEEARRRLERSFYTSTAANIVLLDELRRILKALNAQGIPVIVLKGAALAPTVYPDPALRPMRDLDLLVHRQDLEGALAALRRLDYRGLMRNYFRCHVFMQGGTGGETAVELHWSLVDYSAGKSFENAGRQEAGTVERLWSGAEVLRLDGGQEGLALNPAAHLVYLCAHLWKQHGGGLRLLWCFDLHLLASSGRLDWEAVIEAAQASCAEAAVSRSLELAQRYFGTQVPPGVLDALEAGPGNSGSRRSTAGEVWRGLGWHDRLGMLQGLFFPSPAYVRWRYHPKPVWLWPAFYPVRWVEKTAEVARGFWV